MLESKDTANESRIRSGSNFLGILNDIKRRPEDAAKELNVSIELIKSIIDGTTEIPLDLIDKAVAIWPVNKRDFFVIEDDCPNGIKIMSAQDSEKSSRIMYRAEKPYYEYRDTAMSKVAPFRPEWILELCNVNDNDPENKSVQWNNGHFMHQFTYFIGNVNFYYRDKDGKKQTAVMNTGDSTYGGKLTGEHQQELSTMSNLGDKFALDFSSENSASGSLLKYNREISTVSLTELSTRTGISINTLQDFESGRSKPTISDLEKIALALTINIRDLLPNDKTEDKVIVRHHEDCKTWYYPENTKRYKFHELASTTALPFSKSFEIEISDSSNSELDLTSGLHQYVYNIGETSITLNWEIHGKKHNEIVKPNYSLYMKPFVPHNFRGNGKLLVLRIGGKIPGDSQRELSIVGKDNAKRAISETTLWFDKHGKN